MGIIGGFADRAIIRDQQLVPWSQHHQQHWPLGRARWRPTAPPAAPHP